MTALQLLSMAVAQAADSMLYVHAATNDTSCNLHALCTCCNENLAGATVGTTPRVDRRHLAKATKAKTPSFTTAALKSTGRISPYEHHLSRDQWAVLFIHRVQREVITKVPHLPIGVVSIDLFL